MAVHHNVQKVKMFFILKYSDISLSNLCSYRVAKHSFYACVFQTSFENEILTAIGYKS